MIVGQRFLDLVKRALLAGRQAHNALQPGGTHARPPGDPRGRRVGTPPWP